MKLRRQSRGWLLQAALVGSLSLGVLADVPLSPYDAISSRNPFGLKPPPPPPPVDESANKPPPAPLADVTLTGIITSLLGNSRAFLEIIPAPGKPAIKPILGEGERAENVEVVAINADKNEVTIKMNGTVLTNLTFKVVKSAPTAAPPALGVANPGIVNPVVPNPLQTTAAQPDSGGRRNVMVAGGSGAGGTAAAPAPTPTLTGYNPGTVNPAGTAAGMGAVPNVPNLNPGLRSIPQRAVRPSPQGQPAAAQTPEQAETTRALQYLQMRASEEQAKQRGIAHPPTPPIPGLE